MTKAEFVFKVLDKLFDKSQNERLHFDDVECVASDIVYCGEDTKYCSLDIYKRKDAVGKQPLFINIHGGGFVAGDKHYRRSFSSSIANEGFIVANVNYRLCPAHPFPQFLRDLSMAMKWLEDNADEYNFDLSHAVISGDSAGGHMAAAMCVLASNDAYREALECVKFDTKFLGAVLFCGAYEPTIALGQKLILNLNVSMGKDITGLEKINDETIAGYRYFKELDVGKYADASFPTTFITHTLNDIFCKGHGPRLVQTLRDCGVTVSEMISVNDMHDWHEDMTCKSGAIAMTAVKAFLKELLNGEVKDGTVTIKKGKIIS